MKLRIKGDSLRLRLSQTEVKQLLATGVVEITTHLPGSTALRYAVETRANSTWAGASMEVTFHGARIAVLVSEQDVRTWAEGDQVGLYGTIDTLTVAVEKDFACIDRDDPEDADAFPNPKGAMC